MKKLAIVGAVLLVVAGLATFPSQAVAGSPQDAPMLSAEAFLATLAVPEMTPAPEPPKGLDPVRKTCTATATCGSSPPVTCNGSSTCTSVNRNCANNVRGWVVCDGSLTWCPGLCGCDAVFQECENSCPNQCVKQFQCSPYKCVCGPPCI